MEIVKAIVLKVVNYSETQKIIHVYSHEMGYLSLISPAFLFKKKSTAFHVLQLLEIEFFYHEKSSLHKLKSTSPIVNTPDIYFDIYKMNIGLLWGEILNLTLRNEQKNEDLFHFIFQSVEYLNSTKQDVGNFNLFFLYRLASLIGFGINTSSWSEGFVFNIQDGHFHPTSSALPYVSGPNTAKIIHQFCCCKVEDLKEIPLNRQSRIILLDIILLFLSIHLNLDFNIKSIQVIREIFD